MPKRTASTLLHQHWVHSHEEDTDTLTVYRPASYGFPPSRGRASFDLKPDGSLVEYGIGPTDRPAESEGRWELSDGGKTLALFAGDSPIPKRILRVTSVDRKKLVIKK